MKKETQSSNYISYKFSYTISKLIGIKWVDVYVRTPVGKLEYENLAKRIYGKKCTIVDNHVDYGLRP